MTAFRPEKRIVLAGGLRTPFARAGGAYSKEDAGHLGARVAREILARTRLDPAQLDEVIVGCVGPPYDQANVGRVIALRAGVPQAVPARTVARNCASGMEAVTCAATAIEAGVGELYLCLGVEVMSAYPLAFGEKMTKLFTRLARARSLGQRLGAMASFRPAFLKPRMALTEGLTDPTCGMIMGSTAEKLAREFSIEREEADRFALESHERAKAAREAGRFEGEIVPHMPLGAGGTGGSRKSASSLEHDDGIRDEQTLEALAKLRPYFEKPDGQVTVGNSCGITDGACGMIVASADAAAKYGLEPMAKITSWSWAGLDPSRMGLGPVYSSHGALEAAGHELSEMQAIEINEAFAAQVLACKAAFASRDFALNQLGRTSAMGELDMQRTNPNGGAIALGHPVGATGARLLLTLCHELERRDAVIGLATLCIGGGQGGAVVLEAAL